MRRTPLLSLPTALLVLGSAGLGHAQQTPEARAAAQRIDPSRDPGAALFSRDVKTMSEREKSTYRAWLERNILGFSLTDGRGLGRTAGNPNGKKSVIIQGNKITTSIYNYASISNPGAAANVFDLVWEGLGYGYEFGPLVGAEVVGDDGKTYQIISDGFISTADGDYAPGTSLKWGWLPQDGYSDPASPNLATRTAKDANGDGKPDSWPAPEEELKYKQQPQFYNYALNRYIWPSFLGGDATAPDEEAYWAMDDFTNAEFPYSPFPGDATKRGLGVSMKCRVMQYNNPQAEDIIFFVYEVTNVSPRRLDKVVFGMFGDPHVGGSNDFGDDNADFIGPFDSRFPNESRNMVYAYDADGRGAGGRTTGYFGYKFLESPTNSRDGVDNDDDGLLDESPFNDAGAALTRDQFIARIVNYDKFKARYGEVSLTKQIFWSGDEDGDWTATDDAGNPLDDLGADGIAGTGDAGEGDGRPTQGEPNFGFKDVSESDQIGLTSFSALQFGSTGARPKDDASMWRFMHSGLSSDSVKIAQPADNVFIYGSGDFSLDPGESQRFSVALLLGKDLPDLVLNAKIAQQVFEADYRFVTPPDKPKLTAVAGDGKVTLYWDTRAERSVDPFTRTKDFEGYKIYRSEDYTFSNLQTITDAFGNPFLYEPITYQPINPTTGRLGPEQPAQFDLANGITGLSSEYVGRGVRYQLGSDTGLRHTFVDTNLVNGRTYYYALVAYDHGDLALNIAPSETQHTIIRDPLLQRFVFDDNTAMATPQPAALGNTAPALVGGAGGNRATHVGGNATGVVSVSFIDPQKVPENGQYEVSFELPNPALGITDTVFTVIDQKHYTATFRGRDTTFVSIGRPNLVPGSVIVRDSTGATVDPSRYTIDYAGGRLRSARTSPGALATNRRYTAGYQYYPVFRSEATLGQDFVTIFDGIRLRIVNQSLAIRAPLTKAQRNQGIVDTTRSRWIQRSPQTLDSVIVRPSTIGVSSRRSLYPADYEIQFLADYVPATQSYSAYPDSSTSTSAPTTSRPFPQRVAVPFRIVNLTNGGTVDFVVADATDPTKPLSDPTRRANNRWEPGEKIVLLKPSVVPGKVNRDSTTFEFFFPRDTVQTRTKGVNGQDTIVVADKGGWPTNGDKYRLVTARPFSSGDRYAFSTASIKADPVAARARLGEVFAAPNPYVAYSKYEPSGLRIGERGERRIKFFNLPPTCTIRIYTATGELVRTLQKDDMMSSETSWDLLNTDAQEVAYGVYLFHVSTPDGGETTGRLAIIK